MRRRPAGLCKTQTAEPAGMQAGLHPPAGCANDGNAETITNTMKTRDFGPVEPEEKTVRRTNAR